VSPKDITFIGFAGDAPTRGGVSRRLATSYIAATIVPTDAATPTRVAKNAHASPAARTR
jgi:hypothetical protein